MRTDLQAFRSNAVWSPRPFYFNDARRCREHLLRMKKALRKYRAAATKSRLSTIQHVRSIMAV